MSQFDDKYLGLPQDVGHDGLAGEGSGADVGRLGPVVAMRARIAVYDDLLSSPRIIDIEPAPLLRFIEAIASETYERAQLLGGRLPYSAIREIAENFIHADFKECTVSILDRGDTIRFSDQGPGIERKLLVLQPGVSSANDQMRRYIKGVGSGLPIVREYLAVNQGSLRIDDNAADGVVVTLTLRPTGSEAVTGTLAGLLDGLPVAAVGAVEAIGGDRQPSGAGRPTPAPWPSATESQQPPDATSPPGALADGLDQRSASALRVIADLGAAGPTDLTGPLEVSTATAYRLLESMEQLGLLEKTSNRKRILSNAGLSLLQRLGGY